MESPARLCRSSPQVSLAHPPGKPGFSTLESGCGRETDCPLEGDGFRTFGTPAQRPAISDAFRDIDVQSRSIEFAPDSALEGDGFEPSVPHKKQPFLAAPVRSRKWPSAAKIGSFVPGTEGSNPPPSSGESPLRTPVGAAGRLHDPISLSGLPSEVRATAAAQSRLSPRHCLSPRCP